MSSGKQETQPQPLSVIDPVTSGDASPMGLRYQAVQAAAMSWAASAFSSAAVIGPAAIVRGRALGTAASRSPLG